MSKRETSASHAVLQGHHWGDSYDLKETIYFLDSGYHRGINDQTMP